MKTTLTTTDAQPDQLAGLLNPEFIAQLDVDKTERLFALYEREGEKRSARMFNVALAAFQRDMPPIKKERRETNGKYVFASYDDIMKVARPFLQKHGLAVSFSQDETADTIKVVCRIAHIGGHCQETPFTLPKDGPIKTRDGRNVTSLAQAQGSANSYAKRYCLCNALDIVVTDEDDDGHAAATVTVDPAQVAELNNALAELDEFDRVHAQAALFEWAGIDRMEELPASKFRQALKAINARRK